MLRRAARKLVHVVRRINRAWVDALDPDHEPGGDPFADVSPEPAPRSESVAPPPPPPPAPEPAEPPAPAQDAEPAVHRTVEVWAESTPNPDAVKFSASVPVAPRGALSFDSAEAAASHPLGRAVFGVGGVRSMFAVNDFVTVTREPDADWEELAPRLEAAIADALSR